MKTLKFPWKLRQKVLLISTLFTIIPFAVTNIYWYINAQNTLQSNNEDSIKLIATQEVKQINDFLNTKLLGILSHAQGAALLSGDDKLIEEDLSNLLLQDPDLLSLTYVDTDGQEQVRVTPPQIVSENPLVNIKNSNEFKLAIFKFGKEYIGPVTFDDNNNPQIKISVPITYPKNYQSLKTYSSATLVPKDPGDVFGVLIANVSLDALNQTLKNIEVGNNGYVYLVDHQGTTLSYPNANYVNQPIDATKPELIRTYINESIEQQTIPKKNINFFGQEVLGLSAQIERTGWVVIVELPLQDIYSQVTQIQIRALFLSIIPIAALIILSTLFARQLINPLQQLAKGAENIGKGNFDYPIPQIKSKDEIEQLSQNFTLMSHNLKQEKQNLLAEKNTLSTVLGNIVDGVLALDSSGNILFINPMGASILALKHDFLQKNIDDLVKLTDEKEEVNLFNLCQDSSEHNSTHTLTLVNKESESTVINVVISTLPKNIHTDIAYIITFYDVTKEQALENMKLDFVSMAAHELRTPLTAIKGYLSYLQEKLPAKLSDNESKYFERVIISSDLLSSLIENLLNVTKIEREALTIETSSFSLEKLTEETISSLDQISKQKNIQLTYIKPDQDLPQVQGDPFRISQVITNLVGNAINYTNTNGWVKISLYKEDNSVVFQVEDNGQGIPTKALPHLFTKFFRVSGPLEMGSKGTGLGLYISKSIIDKHNGKIWAESIEGQGSTFRFSLPQSNASSNTN